MRPYLFHIGETPVSSFFFLILVATLVSTFYAVWVGKRNGLNPTAILDLGIIGMMAGVLGARIFHILVEAPDYYWEKPIRVFEFWRGGFVSWGGFILIPIAFLVYFRMRRLPVWPYLDILCVAAPIIKFFIRVGCLLAGCCYGKPTDLPWGIIFTHPDSAAFYFMGTVPLHPTQVYSMIHAGLLFLLVNWVYRRRRFAGQTACILAIGWSLPRALIEFFRGDADRGVYEGGISTGQIMGLLTVILFLFLYRHLRRRHGT